MPWVFAARRKCLIVATPRRSNYKDRKSRKFPGSSPLLKIRKSVSIGSSPPGYGRGHGKTYAKTNQHYLVCILKFAFLFSMLESNRNGRGHSVAAIVKRDLESIE